MLKIQNKTIYVDGRPTKNPELIGLAFLDLIEVDLEKAKKIISKKKKS